ncbi:MAG: hypothetical protein AB9846_15640 [Tenuifilaceae bacterium]
MKKFNNLFYLSAICAVFTLYSCEGPMGPAGENGADGLNGTDANESCKLCHNSASVDAKAIEFEHSLHGSELALEEGTRNSCAPCHSHNGFIDVCKNNTPATFTQNPTDATKWINNYISSPSAIALPGKISCFTCHSSLHSTYTEADYFPLTNTAAVPLTMWGASKSVDFTIKSGNLCAKCHQPRPVTASSGKVIDYALLVSSPTTTYNLSSIGYRTGVHYGAHGAMAAGVGGIEFGTGYTNSQHATKAACSSCHMATPSGYGGGHSFRIKTSAEDASTTTVNFAGCNVTGCHSTMSATNTTYTGSKTTINTKLAELAAKINLIGGANDILMKETDGTYHGYLNIYDASANPTGFYKNPNQGNVAFPALTNAQFGAILNYQLVYRDHSKGVHNLPYMQKLLENTIAAW